MGGTSGRYLHCDHGEEGTLLETNDATVTLENRIQVSVVAFGLKFEVILCQKVGPLMMRRGKMYFKPITGII